MSAVQVGLQRRRFKAALRLGHKTAIFLAERYAQTGNLSSKIRLSEIAFYECFLTRVEYR